MLFQVANVYHFDSENGVFVRTLVSAMSKAMNSVPLPRHGRNIIEEHITRFLGSCDLAIPPSSMPVWDIAFSVQVVRGSFENSYRVTLTGKEDAYAIPPVYFTIHMEDVAKYGFCPVCGAKGVSRERRPNGNDVCENGHSYKSSDSLHVGVDKKESSTAAYKQESGQNDGEVLENPNLATLNAFARKQKTKLDNLWSQISVLRGISIGPMPDDGLSFNSADEAGAYILRKDAEIKEAERTLEELKESAILDPAVKAAVLSIMENWHD